MKGVLERLDLAIGPEGLVRDLSLRQAMTWAQFGQWDDEDLGRDPRAWIWRSPAAERQDLEVLDQAVETAWGRPTPAPLRELLARWNGLSWAFDQPDGNPKAPVMGRRQAHVDDRFLSAQEICDALVPAGEEIHPDGTRVPIRWDILPFLSIPDQGWVGYDMRPAFAHLPEPPVVAFWYEGWTTQEPPLAPSLKDWLAAWTQAGLDVFQVMSRPPLRLPPAAPGGVSGAPEPPNLKVALREMSKLVLSPLSSAGPNDSSPLGEGAPVEETRYHVLASVLRHLEQGDVPTARHTLSQLLDHYINPADPAHLPYLLFAAAASRRLEDHRGGEINLYLRNYERPQIELFQLLADHFPVVPQAGGIANACLLRAWAGHEELTLLDIGIGTGQQEAELLREGARRGCLPRTLHLMAVEPNGDCLPDTRARLNDVAESLGLDLRFHTLVKSAEELSPEDWAFIAALPGPLTVLSAFAMHHLQDAEPQACAREGVFSRIRALNPAALVLCEPNSDHHRPGLFQRFQQAWAHYSALFRLIDSLDLPSDVTGALKTFFAREIEDVLGADETRCERHEPASAWVERLRRTGFRIEVPALENPRPHRGVAPVDHGDYVGLDYEDETLVAIIAASAEQGR